MGLGRRGSVILKHEKEEEVEEEEKGEEKEKFIWKRKDKNENRRLKWVKPNGTLERDKQVKKESV